MSSPPSLTVASPSPKGVARFFGFVPLAALSLLAIVDLPVCPSRSLFGIPCPGCGLTRACRSLLQLDFAEAWRFHPLAWIVAPMLGVVLLDMGIAHYRGRASYVVRVQNPVWGALALLLLGTWLARLLGALGGLSDPIEPMHGLFGRILTWLVGTNQP